MDNMENMRNMMVMAEERSGMMDGGEKADDSKMDEDKMEDDMSDEDKMEDSNMMCMPRKASKCMRDLVYGLINTKAYAENKHCRFVPISNLLYPPQRS